MRNSTDELRKHIYIYIYASMCVFVCIFIHASTCVFVYIYILMQVRVHVWKPNARMCVFVYTAKSSLLKILSLSENEDLQIISSLMVLRPVHADSGTNLFPSSGGVVHVFLPEKSIKQNLRQIQSMERVYLWVDKKNEWKYDSWRFHCSFHTFKVLFDDHSQFKKSY